MIEGQSDFFLPPIFVSPVSVYPSGRSCPYENYGQKDRQTNWFLYPPPLKKMKKQHTQKNNNFVAVWMGGEGYKT